MVILVEQMKKLRAKNVKSLVKGKHSQYVVEVGFKSKPLAPESLLINISSVV